MSDRSRPSLALVVDRLPQWLVANFNAIAAHLEFTVIEISPAPAAAPAGHRFALKSMNGTQSGAASVLQFVGATLDEVKPDAVLTFGWSGGKNLASLAWALDAGVPAVVATDSKVDDFARFGWRERVKGRLLGLYAAAWAAGQQSANYLEHLGMPRERIVVGPVDTIDIDHFEKGAEEARCQAATVRTRLGLPERFFIAVSRLSPEKNLPGLVQAYARYRERAGNAAWHLVIIGEGPSRGEIEAAIAASGMGSFVHLVGWVGFAGLPQYYGVASSFVLASTKDTWGCVVNEAAAARLPLLVSRKAGSHTELVRSGQNGFTFDPLDLDGMAGCMWTLAHGAVDRAAMGALSHEIIQGWSPEAWAESLSQVTRVARANSAGRANWPERMAVRRMALSQFAYRRL